MQSLVDIVYPSNPLEAAQGRPKMASQEFFESFASQIKGQAQAGDCQLNVCATVREPLVWLHDYLCDKERAELLPYIACAIGSATTDSGEIERRLACLVDFANNLAEKPFSFSGPDKDSSDVKIAAAKAMATKSAADFAMLEADLPTKLIHVEMAARAAVATAECIASAAAVVKAFSGETGGAAFNEHAARVKALGFSFLDATLPKVQPSGPITRFASESVTR